MTTKLNLNSAADFASSLASNIARNNDDGNVAYIDSKLIRPVNLAGGWQEYNIDLAATNILTGLPIELKGYAIVYCRDGSTPGALLQLNFDGGGNIQTVLPGQHYIGAFSKVTVSAPNNIVTAGNARLLIIRNPNVDYRELPVGLSAGVPSQTGVIAQTYNSANAPTTATQGLALNGARGVRTLVSTSDAVKTIAGGQVTYWYYSLTDAAWFKSEVTHQLVTGVARTCTSDDEILVPYGRIYAAVESFTDSGGSGSPNVRMQLWGA